MPGVTRAGLRCRAKGREVCRWVSDTRFSARRDCPTWFRASRPCRDRHSCAMNDVPL
jgi:hypothetical protein